MKLHEAIAVTGADLGPVLGFTMDSAVLGLGSSGCDLGPVLVFTMDSAALGLGSSGCDLGTVRVFRLKLTLEDAFEFHDFAPLETRVANAIHSGVRSSYQLAL
jgi:hypothetical protein